MFEKFWLWVRSFFSWAYAEPDENVPGYADPILVTPEPVVAHALAALSTVAQPSYVIMALRFVGYNEAHNITWIMGLFKFTGYTAVTKSTAWCAAFICMLMAKCGLKNTRSAAAAGQAHLGVAMAVTSPFGVCVWKHMTGSLKGHYHTNIALEPPLSYKPHAVKCVGGNQNNSVSVGYYGWPAYELVAYRKPV